MKKIDWAAGSLGNLLLQVLLIQFFISFIFLLVFQLKGLYIFWGGFLQIAIAGAIVSRYYGKRFKKKISDDLRYKISKSYFIFLFLVYVLYKLFDLFIFSSNYGNYIFNLIVNILIFSVGFALLALVLYWALGWFSGVRGKKK